MIRAKDIILPIVAVLLMGKGGDVSGQSLFADTPLVRHLVMDATYVRETRDQAWSVRITGPVPTPPGMYAVVYNERGDLVFRGAVPAGDYSAEAPFVLAIPQDGLAQQYVIKLLGVNQNFYAVTLPMTDLPYEVYGGRDGGTFVMPYPERGEIRRLSFQGRSGVKQMIFAAGDQVLRVLDDRGAVIASNRAADGSGKATNSLSLATQPGQTYWLDPANANQFGIVKGSGKLYLAFDPERWFFPSITWDLESRPWWKGLFRE